MVCISTGSDCLLWAINVGISHGLSFMDNNDWYSSFFSVVDNNVWYSNRFCLSWTRIGGISIIILDNMGDIFTVVSVVGNIG